MVFKILPLMYVECLRAARVNSGVIKNKRQKEVLTMEIKDNNEMHQTIAGDLTVMEN
jgi:hypothetical protein